MTDLSCFDNDYQQAEPGGSFEDIGTGRFQVRFKKIEEKTSQNGNFYFGIQFGVISGEHQGAVVFHNMTVNNKTLGMVKAALQAIGFPGTPEQFRQQCQSFINVAIEIERTANGTDNQGRPQYNTNWKARLEVPLTGGTDFAPPPAMGGQPF